MNLSSISEVMPPDRYGIPPNIPYDEQDPYIFHSITRPVDEKIVRALLSNGAGLVSLFEADEAEMEDNEKVLNYVKAWRRSGVRGRGQVMQVDESAGDDSFVFFTPGYVFNSEFATFAFRLSALQATGYNVQLRVADLQDAYLNAQSAVGHFIPEFPGLYSANELFDDLPNIGKCGTLSTEDTKVVLPEFIRVQIGKKGTYSSAVHAIIQKKMAECARTRLADRVAKQWYAFLHEPFSAYRGGKNRPELLLEGAIGLQEAEQFRLTRTAPWVPVRSLRSES